MSNGNQQDMITPLCAYSCIYTKNGPSSESSPWRHIATLGNSSPSFPLTNQLRMKSAKEAMSFLPLTNTLGDDGVTHAPILSSPTPLHPSPPHRSFEANSMSGELPFWIGYAFPSMVEL